MASPHDDPNVTSPLPRVGATRAQDATATRRLPAGGSDDDVTSLLPMLDDPRRRFDTVMRGYDRHQVDLYVGKLEDDNRLLVATRNETSARSADLAAQLARAQSEIESVRRRLVAAAERIDPSNVDARVQELVTLAQGVARRTRADAEAEAARIREAARAHAETVRTESRAEADQVLAAATSRLADADERYTRLMADADRHAGEVGARAAQELTLARQEVAALRETAAAEVAEADAAARAAREQADLASRTAREQAEAAGEHARRTAEEDFQITLRLRRAAAEAEDHDRRAASSAQAAEIVRTAREAAARALAAANAEVDRLHEHRVWAHGELRAVARRLDELTAQHDPDRVPFPAA